MKNPNFFLVGAPKAGTTSLYRYLDQHPEIYMSPIKEPHYFADEIREENFDGHMRAMAAQRNKALRQYLEGSVTEKFSGGPISDWRDYLKLFRAAEQEKAVGEASTCYLWSRTAPSHIAAAFPNARIIIVLRDPAERAFSQYRHMLSFAEREIPFRAYLDAGIEERNTRIGETYPFLWFGLYAGQITRYLSHFARENVHIAFYQEFVADPKAFVAAIYKFLGVDDAFRPDMSEHHMQAAVPQLYALNRGLKRSGVWALARSMSPPGLRRRLRRLAYRPSHSAAMASGERARLVEFYREDIQRLSLIVQRDLSCWLRCDAAASPPQ